MTEEEKLSFESEPTYIDEYRQRALKADITLMGGRAHANKIFINDRIATHLKPHRSEVLVDIGCGDGYFLFSQKNKFLKGMGIIPTIEEANRLRQEYVSCDKLSFSQGLAQQLPLPNAYAEKIVCNGVFPILPGEKDAKLALQEIYRVLKPGGVVWIGEIPASDERSYFKPPPKPNLIKRSVAFVFRHGIRIPKKLIEALRREKQTQIIKKWQAQRTRFCADPTVFLVLADELGFELISHMRSQDIDPSGKVGLHPTRWDYLLKKPSQDRAC